MASLLPSVSSPLDINHLEIVLDLLKLVPKRKWQELGLKLGLLQPTLDTIDANHSKDVERCLKECLSQWLMRGDNVDEYGHPTLLRLADALEEIGDKATADKIRGSTLREEGHGSIVAVTIFPEDLKSAYLLMNGKFAKVLVRIVKAMLKETTVEDVKLYLVALEPGVLQKLETVNDSIRLTAYLREHCHLSNFGLLPYLIDNEDFKLESFKDEVEHLKRERDDFYEKMLATDFAKLAIEDHKTSEGQSEISFKVSWNLQDTTLREFEEFLNVFFLKYRIHISLKSVRQSLLTFVCTIPSWLVEEIIDFVWRNIDSFQLNGVVEICVDSTVIPVDSSYDTRESVEEIHNENITDLQSMNITDNDEISEMSIVSGVEASLLMSSEGNENISTSVGNETLYVEEQAYVKSLENTLLSKEKAMHSMSLEIEDLKTQIKVQKDYWHKVYGDMKRDQQTEIEMLRNELVRHRDRCKLVLPEVIEKSLMASEIASWVDVSVESVIDLQEKFPKLEEYLKIRFQSSSTDALHSFLLRVQKSKLSHICFYDTINWTKNSIDKLSKFIANTKTLKDFQLVHSGEKRSDGFVSLNDSIIASLCKALSGSSVESVSICSCELSNDGVYMLIDMLVDNTNLLRLTLDGKYEKNCKEHSNYYKIKEKLYFH